MSYLFNKDIVSVFGQRYLESVAKNPIKCEVDFILSVIKFNKSVFDTYFRDQPLTPPNSV